MSSDTVESTPDEERSAFETAQEEQEDVDPRTIPQTLEEPPPVGDEIEYPDYPDEDHETWQILVERQMEQLPGRACEAYMRGQDVLGLEGDRIPDLADLSRRLNEETGWEVANVPGLIHEKNFFSLLSQRKFPSTNYVRGREELDYTPAPDCFHDIFGHMPMLTQPEFADFYQLYGQAAQNAEGADRPRLERFHWFTVEFGLIQEQGEKRIFGAGIVSSNEEVTHALSDEVTLHAFDPEHIVEKDDYEVYNLQKELFVLDSFEQLVDGFRDWTSKNGLL
ncbi:phenylalanine-4-hydroxylase [Salinibacter ruber]|jgi:phenylalanine-4-hydroxylase|uniref:Phenylalanine-4-hydroxylase n=2 Tax=Salinibacter ruber TaxID=146919 RepID=A0A9X2TZV1_9BACT|nr:phenylalanine 4-monooxygenase [Salinibacter ruber]MBB4061336.1 phenylalanine-4-hydroxylase [Salinibacter ruber]MBB4069460.1 phenylalanine-4-hydroxylase [Salinibacter ruber]MCS3656844.1 phenylalanine-4-hydroxylase [Salinibacter ruber]MCS3658700.1 phenylalanine-4-hydroxylase [Salinibacter ruber]MCS3671007.1 phenylalanine-4-hydroxylase [Salinibacter ruber]